MQPVMGPHFTQMQPVIGPLDATIDGTAALQPDATRDGYLRGECYSPAGRKNIILFDGDPLSGAVVSDDIQSLSKSALSIYSADRRMLRPS